jgi:predicted signal transduction protein with EAL and GGDEF domain
VLRDVDLVARWGGEEFVIAMPDIDCEQAIAVLERVRSNLAKAHQGGHAPFTASFGVTDSTKGDSLQRLVQLADVGLYMSKAAGRDRITVADDLASIPVDGNGNGHANGRLRKPALIEASTEEDPYPGDFGRG